MRRRPPQVPPCPVRAAAHVRKHQVDGVEDGVLAKVLVALLLREEVRLGLAGDPGGDERGADGFGDVVQHALAVLGEVVACAAVAEARGVLEDLAEKAVVDVCVCGAQ